MSRSVKLFMILALWLFGSLWTSSALALNEVLNVRHWVAPDHTRVVIDMSGEAVFTVEKEEGRLAVDLEATSFPSHIPPTTLLRKPGLEAVAISLRPPSGVRISLSLPGEVQTTIFRLKRFEDKPDRIVIDLVLPEVARQESEKRQKVKITRKDRIVVVDPGHGGEAPGAVGRRGTMEKDVVLSISRKLRDMLNRKEGYRAFLTRDGDYYVSFSKRLQIAREYGADLFISVHADAARNRHARGSSVYSLSTGGASSEAAKILAQYENLADIVGGVPTTEGNGDSDPIILDMFQTHTINQSKTFGHGLLKLLEEANPLKFVTVQEAPFRVLKLPEIPSILIETAYLSNPKEENLLRSSRFQKRIAEKVVKSVVEFLPPLPPVLVAVSGGKGEGEKPGEKAAVEAGPGPKAEGGRATENPRAAKSENPGQAKVEPPSAREKVSLYRVRKGDTLGKIARVHNSTIGVLLKLNAMKLRDPLHVGRLLKVPVAETETRITGKRNSAGKPYASENSGTSVYLVKRGDTLSAIARRHGTTVRVLMELNRLKTSDPLPVDRKLVLPGKSSI
ncbi:MAG: N-acetylmuramoyl-L-alanine amidase [Proteobacteria bacterium]|nr:N-acetylmuramoyl-L-alanine amidase [Pseudomonadota bacterium]MBU2226662.1 N-acetylmuramoyl-L-alanine amidase [Pseudomonadota bacterium]MBU2262573.1 N-acetylmuramoyl-L-alanine amidase [Pseudomonadota bacterium]